MAMTPEQQARASEFWRAAEQHLRKLSRTDNPNYQPQWMGPRWGMGLGPAQNESYTFDGMGGLNVPYGKAPTPDDVNRFIESMGGNPYSQNPRGNQQVAGKSGNQPATTPKPKDGEKPGDIFRRLLAEFQSKTDEANAANQARYDEGKAIYSDLAARNQDRVANWGIAAQQDIEDRLKAMRGENAANLAARGLGHTTIGAAFDAKAARDTAREQQRVSEMRDARASEYDTRDQTALAQFIERRNDVAPDPSMLIGLGDRIGQAEAAAQAMDQRQKMFDAQMGLENRRLDLQYQAQQAPQIPYYPAPVYGGNRGPVFTNLFAGQGSFIPQASPITSNRYPTPRYTMPQNNVTASNAAIMAPVSGVGGLGMLALAGGLYR